MGAAVHSSRCRYSSSLTALTLATRGYHLLSTVRSTRKGLPDERMLCNKHDALGTVKAYATKLLGDMTLYFVSWKDKKVVNFLTTLKPGKVMRPTRIKKGRRWHNEQRFVPTTKLIYDQYMGGVDTLDSYLLRMWTKFRKRKWHMGFSDYYICVAIFCSFDIYKVNTLVLFV